MTQQTAIDRNRRTFDSRAWFLSFALAVLPAFVLAGPVNVNTADARTLAKELEGVGKSKAEAIVAHRDKNGPFKSVDEVAKVKGIGKKLVDRNRPNLRLDAKAEPSRTSEAGGKSRAPEPQG